MARPVESQRAAPVTQEHRNRSWEAVLGGECPGWSRLPSALQAAWGKRLSSSNEGQIEVTRHSVKAAADRPGWTGRSPGLGCCWKRLPPGSLVLTREGGRLPPPLGSAIYPALEPGRTRLCSEEPGVLGVRTPRFRSPSAAVWLAGPLQGCVAKKLGFLAWVTRGLKQMISKGPFTLSPRIPGLSAPASFLFRINIPGDSEHPCFILCTPRVLSSLSLGWLLAPSPPGAGQGVPQGHQLS